MQREHNYLVRRLALTLLTLSHVMSPFAGLGVNLAFSDSVALANAIIASVGKSRETLDAAILKCEQDMYKVRCSNSSEQTRLELACSASSQLLCRRR
jgi:2-polyprenyl-6-methoxyphenol hydroxylase-like FAD-dependent oxidoreductase